MTPPRPSRSQLEAMRKLIVGAGTIEHPQTRQVLLRRRWITPTSKREHGPGGRPRYALTEAGMRALAVGT